MGCNFLFFSALFLINPSWAQDKKTLDEKKDIAADVALIASERPYWLKIYSLVPYSEEWTLNIKVNNLQKDLPKVLKVFENTGAALIVPVQNSVAGAKSQQLSYKLSDKMGREALKNLKKPFFFEAPRVRLAAESTPLAEIKAKIEKLMPERSAHAKELAAMPAISALTDELLEHLLLVESIAKKKETQVLLNMTVEERN